MQACTCKQSQESINEESIVLNNLDKIQINAPCCRYCTGYTNGHIYGLIKNKLDRSLEKAKQTLANLGKNFNFEEIEGSADYKAGFAAGEDAAAYFQNEPIILANDRNNVGEIAVGKSEFGEVYHTAAAMLCNKFLTVNVNEASFDQTIFICNVFGTDRINFNSIKNPKVIIVDNNEYRQSFSKTSATSIFCQAFDTTDTTDIKQVFDRVYEAFTRNLLHNDKEKLIESCFNYLKNLGLDNLSNKAILWIRNVPLEESKFRNMHEGSLYQFIGEIQKSGIDQIIIMGDKLDEEESVFNKYNENITFYDFRGYYHREGFRRLVGHHVIAGQLLFCKILHEFFGVKFAIGMMSGAMDGAAFIGVPTIFLSSDSKADSRMYKASQSIKSLRYVYFLEGGYKQSKKFDGKSLGLISAAITSLRAMESEAEAHSPRQSADFLSSESEHKKPLDSVASFESPCELGREVVSVGDEGIRGLYSSCAVVRVDFPQNVENPSRAMYKLAALAPTQTYQPLEEKKTEKKRKKVEKKEGKTEESSSEEESKQQKAKKVERTSGKGFFDSSKKELNTYLPKVTGKKTKSLRK